MRFFAYAVAALLVSAAAWLLPRRAGPPRNQRAPTAERLPEMIAAADLLHYRMREVAAALEQRLLTARSYGADPRPPDGRTRKP